MNDNKAKTNEVVEQASVRRKVRRLFHCEGVSATLVAAADVIDADRHLFGRHPDQRVSNVIHALRSSAVDFPAAPILPAALSHDEEALFKSASDLRITLGMEPVASAPSPHLLDMARQRIEELLGAFSYSSAQERLRSALSSKAHGAYLLDEATKRIDEMLAATAGQASFAGVRFRNHQTRRFVNESQPGRVFVTFKTHVDSVFDVEAAEALKAHADAGTVAMLYGPEVAHIAGWGRLVEWATSDTIRAKETSEVEFTFELHGSREEGVEASRHRFGYQRDETPPVVETADYGAKVAASNKLRSLVGLFPDGALLSADDIEAACKDIEEKGLLIAKANGYVPDAEPLPLPVADLRMGTTVPDMGELKEWLADHLKLTWAARFPNLAQGNSGGDEWVTEREAAARRKDLANAFADEHRALADSLDKVFHDGTKEPEDEDEAPDSFEGVPSYRPPTADIVAVMDAAPTEAPIQTEVRSVPTMNVGGPGSGGGGWSIDVGVLDPINRTEQMIMAFLAQALRGLDDAYFPTTPEQHGACERLESLGYIIENDQHSNGARNWSLTPKGHAFNLGTKPTSEDSPVDPWRTIEGVLVVDAERSILRTLVTAGLGASMVTHSAESPAVRAAGRRLCALGYLASAGQPYPAEVMLTDKGRHLALHTVEPGDALPFIAIDGRELSDAEVEQNTFAMIRGGTCVSAAKGADPHQAGGTKTNAALRRLAASGLIEQWENEGGIAWGTKETRARLSPPAPRAPEPTTISADPLLDAAEDAMLNKLRRDTIVNNPERPFSELTYQALGSLVKKGKAISSMASTGERTWHIFDVAYERKAAQIASNKHHPGKSSPFEGNPLDANDPRNDVHALVAEHGGFGKALSGSTTFTRDGLLINGKPHALNDAFKLVIALLELLQQAPSDVDGFGFIDGTKLIPNPSGSSRAHVVTCQAYAGLRHDLLTKLHGTLAAATDSTRRQLSVATGSLSYWTAELATLAIPNA